MWSYFFLASSLTEIRFKCYCEFTVKCFDFLQLKVKFDTVWLTGLLGRIFDKQRGDILVHSHLILGDAGIGSGVLVPDAANKELTTICYKKRGNKRKRNKCYWNCLLLLFEIFLKCITYTFETVNLQSYKAKQPCLTWFLPDCWFLQCSRVRLIINLRCTPNIWTRLTEKDTAVFHKKYSKSSCSCLNWTLLMLSYPLLSLKNVASSKDGGIDVL